MRPTTEFREFLKCSPVSENLAASAFLNWSAVKKSSPRTSVRANEVMVRGRPFMVRFGSLRRYLRSSPWVPVPRVARVVILPFS